MPDKKKPAPPANVTEMTDAQLTVHVEESAERQKAADAGTESVSIDWFAIAKELLKRWLASRA